MGRKHLILYLAILTATTACNVHKSASEQYSGGTNFDSTTTESHLSFIEKLSHDSLSLEIIDISSTIYDSFPCVRIRAARLINNRNKQSRVTDTFNKITATDNSSKINISTDKDSSHKSNNVSVLSLFLLIAIIIIATISLIIRKFKLNS